MRDLPSTFKLGVGKRTTVCSPGVREFSQSICCCPPEPVGDPVQMSMCRFLECQSVATPSRISSVSSVYQQISCGGHGVHLLHWAQLSS